MKKQCILFFFICIFLLVACNKEKRAPLLEGIQVVQGDSLNIYGLARLYNPGDAEIAEVGYCWTKTGVEPTLADNHAAATLSQNLIIDTIRIFTPGTRVLVRAYARNAYGTSYSSTYQVMTGQVPELIPVTTGSLLALSTNSMQLALTVNGNTQAVSELGYCYSTEGLPVVTNSTTSALKPFTSKLAVAIHNLSRNTVYYLRPYSKTAAGISYGELIVVKTFYATMKDNDGFTYYTTLIGDKEWVAENIRSTLYRDGSAVNFLGNSSNFLSPGYVYPNGSSGNFGYGYQYNYYALEGAKLLAPQGWHIPSADDYLALLADFETPLDAYKALMQPTAGNYEPTETNVPITAFNAVPAGYRADNGWYNQFLFDVHIWSSTSLGSETAFSFMHFGNKSFSISNDVKKMCCSLRFVKD